jgi:hypothetical protein
LPWQVIGYIASHFRKDKIWMRRTRPDKRRYQVLLAIDNSRSMAENGCGAFALEATTLIAKALSRCAAAAPWRSRQPSGGAWGEEGEGAGGRGPKGWPAGQPDLRSRSSAAAPHRPSSAAALLPPPG